MRMLGKFFKELIISQLLMPEILLKGKIPYQILEEKYNKWQSLGMRNNNNNKRNKNNNYWIMFLRNKYLNKFPPLLLNLKQNPSSTIKTNYLWLQYWDFLNKV